MRFWRYPVWQHSMLILNGDVETRWGNVRGSAWATRFRQGIDEYAGAAYDALENRQLNLNRVAGSRVIWTRPVTSGTVRLVGNVLTTTHVQEDLSVQDGEGTTSEGELRFAQRVYSLGAEFERALTRRVTALVGVSIDRTSMPQTGDKPRRDPFTDYGATVGLVYRAANAVQWRFAAARKARFPTLRELFGEALARFRVNPDLAPETTYMAEIGPSIRGRRSWIELTAFASRTRDAIGQDVLPDGRRMRINLDGSRTVGVEASGRTRSPAGWFLNGHVTWLHTRGYEEDGGTRPVPERPRWLATGALGFDFRSGASLLGQAEYTGRAHSLGPGGGFEVLPSSLVFNARAAYRGFLTEAGLYAEWFLRIDNVMDAVVVPQLGLPAAGREVVAGVSFTF